MRPFLRASVLLLTLAIGVVIGATVGISAASNYPKGDMNCDNNVGPVDALIVLKYDAGVPATLPGGCAPLGLPDASTPTPTSPSGSTFGNGTWLVGSEVQPGLFRNSSSSGGCYWARLSGLGGTIGEILANNFTNAINTVQIKPGDLAFESDDCGTWSQNLIPPSSGPNQPFGDGQWLVTEEVAAGTRRNSDSSGGCYWERLSGFGGNISDIIANSFSMAIQTVQVSAGDAGFTSDDCGTWTKIG